MSLRRAGTALGVPLERPKMSVGDLHRARRPGIPHVDGGHFAALVGFTRDGCVVVDPSSPTRARRQVWSREQLQCRWDGHVPAVVPGHRAPDALQGPDHRRASGLR
ncbi:MAG: hypothetical protein IT208_00745 [Chthonomonadales bacterium]|nr:hypothetical protein [Chthonomonadales bacterium]